jgi:hypothetical protein
MENVASAGRVPLQLPTPQDTTGDLFRDPGGAIRVVGNATSNLTHAIAACPIMCWPHRIVALVVPRQSVLF